MAKPIIKKESYEFDIEKIKRFTDAEMQTLSNSRLPFCYQLDNNILIVGQYKIIKINNTAWQVTKLPGYEFFSRKDAIFYCIAMHSKRYKLASEIQLEDSLISKLNIDAIHYRYRYKTAIENNDLWNLGLFSDRYTETINQLGAARERLQKSLIIAKYIKG